MNRQERRAAAKTGNRPGQLSGDVSQRNAALFAEAVRHHQAGRVKEAHQLCQQILEVDARDINALHLSGVIALQVGLNDVALDMLKRAVALGPAQPALHNSLGDACRSLSRADEAIACYRRAVAAAPDFAPAQFNLGTILFQQEQPEAAAAALQRATALLPNSPVAHNNLGIALAALGRLDAAMSAYRRAIAINPAYVEAHNNLGNAHRERREPEPAIACYRRALQQRADYPAAHNNLGIVLMDQGKLAEAEAAFRQAIGLAPGYADAHDNLGTALRLRGELDQAIAAHRQALAHNPAHLGALNNLGVALRERGETQQAIACYRQALAANPNVVDVLANLGVALREQGSLQDAIEALQAALRLQPGFAMAEAELIYAQSLACDWRGSEDWAARLVAAATQPRAVAPFVALTQGVSPVDQLFCARQWVGEPTREIVFDRPARAPGPKIRLGYLSKDFRADAVGAIIPDLIERHDRGRFEVVAYCYGPDDGSPLRARLRGAFDRFTDIGALSITGAANQIHADEVDILVDLMGFTQSTRSQILAHRPAPIQVSYLGYPGTMGADFVDYAIVDPHIVPADRQQFYTERLVHLLDCYQPSDTKRPIAGRIPSRAECGLPERGFVFCSFNNSYKITAAFFDIWMRLLRAVPGSVLWLIDTGRLVVENLRREAATRGIEPERLVFAGRVPMPDYLARLRVADLFLDTLPYNAGATANDALWAGLPLVTCSGETYVGRMAGSLLKAVGLAELVTAWPAEYEALALRLATEPARLAEIRQKLERNRAETPLFDMQRYTGRLEAAYTQMQELRRRGDSPRSFAVPALP